MNFITTNIRLPEDDYLRLKSEAAKKRKSLSAVIREKLKEGTKEFSEDEISMFMSDLKKIAQSLGKKLKGFDSIKALREMRYEK